MLKVAPAEIPEKTLNESPSEKEGKFFEGAAIILDPLPSMKVPPKRKGNLLRKEEGLSLS